MEHVNFWFDFEKKKQFLSPRLLSKIFFSRIKLVPATNAGLVVGSVSSLYPRFIFARPLLPLVTLICYNCGGDFLAGILTLFRKRFRSGV